MQPPAVEMLGIWKTFPPGVVANRDVRLSVAAGEIHAIVGENGAGKSTLMNLLYGIHRPDEGSIAVRGQRVQIGSPRVAKRLGIGMVHQHFMLVPSFTVAQNVVLGYEPAAHGAWVDFARAEAEVAAVCRRYGLSVPPRERVVDLPVGVQQRVEIVKAIYRGAEVLILDEPTAVLGPLEARDLFATCREMAGRGKTILFISHKLREVLSVSDRITVMRQGRSVATLRAGETDEHELARLIVGRDRIWSIGTAGRDDGGPVVLEVGGLTARGPQSTLAVRGVSFRVKAGEILGIAGVEGNGQSELMAALAGLVAVEAGQVCLEGQDITAASPATRRSLGMGHIPDDRLETGSCLQASIAENLIVTEEIRRRCTGRAGVLRWPAVYRHAARLIRDFGIAAPGPASRAGTLSGGNLQKVVLARELTDDLRCLLLLHPTRGLDIAASEFVYRRLLEAKSRGCAIVLVSADLDELFLVSDRIAVMYAGRIAGEFRPREVTAEEIGLYMTGVRGAEASQ